MAASPRPTHVAALGVAKLNQVPQVCLASLLPGAYVRTSGMPGLIGLADETSCMFSSNPLCFFFFPDADSFVSSA